MAAMSLIERIGPSYQVYKAPGDTSLVESPSDWDVTGSGTEVRRKRFYMPVLRAISKTLESMDTTALPPPTLFNRIADRILRESGRPIKAPSLYRARASSLGDMLVNYIIKLEVVEPLLPFATAYEIMIVTDALKSNDIFTRIARKFNLLPTGIYQNHDAGDFFEALMFLISRNSAGEALVVDWFKSVFSILAKSATIAYHEQLRIEGGTVYDESDESYQDFRKYLAILAEDDEATSAAATVEPEPAPAPPRIRKRRLLATPTEPAKRPKIASSALDFLANAVSGQPSTRLQPSAKAPAGPALGVSPRVRSPLELIKDLYADAE